jgi:drug/metabolite transporter (DMT)-like permease
MIQAHEPTLQPGLPSVTSIATIFLLAVIWGLSIPLTKLGLEALPPLTLTALRFVAALPPLFLLALRQRLPFKALPRVALLGIIGILVAAALFGDRLGPAFALGVLLILGSLALVMAPNRQA